MPNADVEKYLAAIESPAFRAAVIRLRDIVLGEVEGGTEAMSYGLPSVRLGTLVAAYGAFKKHCSFFPSGLVEQFSEELQGFTVSKGTIQFTPEQPIPDELVRRMVRARLAEIEKKVRKRPQK